MVVSVESCRFGQELPLSCKRLGYVELRSGDPATAVGLFAAVPAVIAYNYFLGRIKDVIQEMEDFSLEFLTIAERLHGS